jgi:CDGSH-type Zn-finger protein
MISTIEQKKETKMEKSKINTKKAAKFKVKVTKNGPYVVSGGVPLAEQIMCIDEEGQCHGWKEGQRYPQQETYALCRCDHSSNKPYCDGTHNKINFSGAETASHRPYLEEAEEIIGPGLKLTDVQNLCASARFCHRGGGTWTLAEQSDNPDAKQKVIEETADCPSGRLVAWDKDGKVIEPDFEPSIGLVEDVQAGKMGPIWVRCGIPIEAADGTTYEIRNRVTLCRCGKSLNKPFCDGRHLR